jgi:thiol-disulfide isomerase/thioredoxin
MKKILVVQITTFLLVAGFFSGMLVFTPVYEEVNSRIVNVLCLSCLKLTPVVERNFTFVTANGEPQPDFVLDNLTKGPVFLHYSADVCEACDKMLPIIQSYLNVSFNKSDSFSSTITIQHTNITYIYINIDHTSKERRSSIDIYDKVQKKGVPMFTFITLGYDNGLVKPVFASIYGEQPRSLIEALTSDIIDLFHQNHEGFTHSH